MADLGGAKSFLEWFRALCDVQFQASAFLFAVAGSIVILIVFTILRILWNRRREPFLQKEREETGAPSPSNPSSLPKEDNKYKLSMLFAPLMCVVLFAILYGLLRRLDSHITDLVAGASIGCSIAAIFKGSEWAVDLVRRWFVQNSSSPFDQDESSKVRTNATVQALAESNKVLEQKLKQQANTN